MGIHFALPVKIVLSSVMIRINITISALKYMALTSQRRKGASKKEMNPADVSELLEKQLGVCSSNLFN